MSEVFCLPNPRNTKSGAIGPDERTASIRFMGITASRFGEYSLNPHDPKIDMSIRDTKELTEIMDWFYEDTSDIERQQYGDFLQSIALRQYKEGVHFDSIKRMLREARQHYQDLRCTTSKPGVAPHAEVSP